MKHENEVSSTVDTPGNADDGRTVTAQPHQVHCSYGHEHKNKGRKLHLWAMNARPLLLFRRASSGGISCNASARRANELGMGFRVDFGEQVYKLYGRRLLGRTPRLCPISTTSLVGAGAGNSSSTTNTRIPDRSSLPKPADTDVVPPSSPPSTSEYMKAALDLSKARLSALVVVTTAAGFLTAGGPVSYPTLASAAVGTALCSSSASTLNQIFEVDRDRRMKRTRNRPLVAGVVKPSTAIILAGATGIGGGGILALGTDPITAILGVSNIALYAGAYTYLKPRSELNTWVGAVVGAVPPVMGWTAATGGSLFDMEAAFLGGLLYLWQFPHFFALSWMHRTDYARGGFQMVPVNDVETMGDRTAALIGRYTWYLSAVPVVSSVMGVTSSMFAVEGIALNAYALFVAGRFDRERTNANARKVFLTSLWYLPCVMTLFILHSRRWKDATDKNDEEMSLGDEDIVAALRRRAGQIRNFGKEICVHELFVNPGHGTDAGGNDNAIDQSDDASGASACPVAIVKNKISEATKAGVASVASAAAASGNSDGSVVAPATGK